MHSELLRLPPDLRVESQAASGSGRLAAPPQCIRTTACVLGLGLAGEVSKIRGKYAYAYIHLCIVARFSISWVSLK